MRKLKLLGAVCALILGGGNFALAQTDVTSTYVVNNGFESCTARTSNLAAGGSAVGEDYTSAGWKLAQSSAWSSSAVVSYGGSGQVNGASAPSADNAGNTGNALGFSVGWNGTNKYQSATAVTLPAGRYELKVYAYNNLSGKTNFKSVFGFVPTSGSSYLSTKTTFAYATWVTDIVTFDLTEATEGKFQIGGTAGNSGSNENAKVFFDNITLTHTPFADSDDYNALNAAISTVEGKAWGFDTGEYAPYNYVSLFETLATAKAIDQTANNLQPTIQALTATLNGATWTANTEEVNAIWDGSFQHDYSGQTGNIQPIGWYRVKGTTGDGYNVRYVTSSGNAGVGYLSSSCGLFTKMNAYYGWADGYTMPLKASSYYTLKFSAGGWGDCEDRTDYVQITDPSSTTTTIETFTAKNTTANTDNTSSSWSDISTIFQTGGSGNYVLGLIPRNNKSKSQNQFVYGDFVLKATTVAEATAYYNTVLNEVDDSYDDEANGGTEKSNFKTAIDASVPSTVNEIMAAAANLYTLRDAFVAATPKYDLYVAEKANAERIDASITSDVSAPTTAEEADAAHKAILVNEYNYVRDNFNADAATYYGITIDQWTGTATSGGNSDTPGTNSDEKWGTSATTYYEQGANGWSSSAWTLNYTKTVTLPANKYVLKVSARASSGVTATLSATIGETTITEALPNVGSSGKGITTAGVASFGDGEFANSNNGYGWQWRYLAFTLESEGPVTLNIDASANSKEQWCSFGDVAVVSNVTTDGLETAYNNFEMRTLGFENGQYAPYDNVDLLEALAEAKSIVVDGTVPSTQAEVDALTTTLTAAVWSAANDGDVDAIYNGTFAETGTGNNPKGWTRSNNGWGQQITGLTAATNGVNEGTTTAWYYNNNGAWQYGNDGVYTMPLAASTSYKLTFKYAKHGSDGHQWMKASVTKSDDNEVVPLNAVQYPGSTNNTKYTSVSAYFTTTSAGNYILSLENNGNVHMTDVSLVKVASATVALNETASFATTEDYAYADVTLARTIKKDTWNTFCVPFDISNDELQTAFGDDVEVAEFAETADGDNSSVSFTKMATAAITANTPVLLKTSTAGTSYSFTGRTIKAGDAKVEGAANFDFVGCYDAQTYVTTGNYYLTNNYLYRSTSDNGTYVNGTRAYIKAKDNSSDARIGNFSIIDDTTEGIDNVKATSHQNGKTYNLNGQQVSKAQKGLYIQNGKKVVVK